MSKEPKKGELLSPLEKLVEKTKAEATLKAEELSKKINKNVYPLVFVRSEKEIYVGFIQEPTRPAKMEAFDVLSAKESMTLAGEVILSTSLMKEESHEAFAVVDSKYDDVYMSACVDCLGHVKALMNVLKKK